MPDCQMCWNTWPTLNETPFPQLAGIMVCRNCDRDFKKMVAFCRHHGIDLVGPQVGANSDSVTAKPDPDAATGEEPPQPPRKKPGKAS